MKEMMSIATRDGLEKRNNKERRRWAAGGGNGTPRRKRDNRSCLAAATCKKHALVDSVYCAKHTDF
jgi:hypothetical protein